MARFVHVEFMLLCALAFALGCQTVHSPQQSEHTRPIVTPGPLVENEPTLPPEPGGETNLATTPADQAPRVPIMQVSVVQVVEEHAFPLDNVMMEPEFTLTDAIEHAFAASPDLVAAAEQLAAADAALARARAEFYPKIGISEQYGVSDNPVSAFMFQLNQRQLNPVQDFNHPATTDDFHTQVRVQHNVYSGERRLHEMHAACAQSSTAALQLAALHNQLVFRVAEAYYRVLQVRGLAEVRQEAVSQVEEHLRIVETRFRNETAVKSDVLTVEVRLAEVREASISAQNKLKLAWAVLENVTGAPIGTRTVPQSIPEAPWSDQVAELEAAIAIATSERDEIGALASQRQAATEGIFVARAGKRLGVDVVVDYDVYTGDFQHAADSFFRWSRHATQSV